VASGGIGTWTVVGEVWWAGGDLVVGGNLWSVLEWEGRCGWEEREERSWMEAATKLAKIS